MSLPDPPLRQLYDRPGPPWAILPLLWLGARHDPLDPALRSAGERLLTVAESWWPALAPPARDIYQRDLAPCWDAYGARTHTKAEAAAGQLHLRLLHLLVFLLGRSERTLRPERPRLPNDMAEWGYPEYRETIEQISAHLDAEEKARLETWLASTATDSPGEWAPARAALFGGEAAAEAGKSGGRQ